jgi:hypothetical protein
VVASFLMSALRERSLRYVLKVREGEGPQGLRVNNYIVLLEDKRPALADSVSAPQQTLQHHPHSLTPRSKDKTDHLLCIRR